MDLQDLLNQGPEGEGKKKTDSPLLSLKTDLDFYKESIQEVSAEMMAEGYTLYPIFVAHQHQVDLGEMILDRGELNTQWSIQASSLEEFVDRGIIKEDRKAYFEKQFKPANDFMCLFVVVPEGANFVFYPYA
ncbi:hypothetical protein [Sphingobacterium lactis]|uniref:Uncharacterized protein n=1 Tax=Sphingobacterium lactis TaxID=797291 RepID=A0A1H5VGJ6_9SPHI|nr:hypothetical protein [Sphingobacterium lactis]SEF86334.1 hypothetical protein SAMN05421877_103127 [Sphingobacterium lactis]